MRRNVSLFTPGERRVAGLALLGAAVLTLSLVALEKAWTPPLGIYGASTNSVSLPNVIDARPLSRAATF